MRTIKIGRSTANDVILNDPTVSSLHAVLTVSALAGSRSYRLKDLNSSNGTYVNGVRITSEVSVTSADTIKFGNYITNCNTLLNINKTRVSVPNNKPNPTEIESEKKIGRTPSPVNDISFPYQDVSASHAVLLKKKTGDVVIVDNGSTNGTYVNGNKVTCSILKPGDKVLISNKYPLLWEKIYPIRQERIQKSIIIPVMASIACMAIVAILLWWAPWKPWEPGKKGTAEEIFSYYNKTVVLIYQTYYFEVSANGETLGQFVFDNNDEIVALEDAGYPMGGFGTGFFVSDDGLIMTNRHVMNPYSLEQEHINQLKRYFEISLDEYATVLQRENPQKSAIYRNAANNISVEIKVYQTRIAPNDTHVTSMSDFLPCTVLGDTGSDEIDLGLIQLNSKRLPEGCTNYVNVSLIDNGISEGKDIYTIGFPQGLIIGSTNQGVEAQKQSGQISQVRGKVQFGHNLNIDHGSSGSPIFSERGYLIGIVNAGFLGSAGNFNIGIQAKYAEELINKYN